MSIKRRAKQSGAGARDFLLKTTTSRSETTLEQVDNNKRQRLFCRLILAALALLGRQQPSLPEWHRRRPDWQPALQQEANYKHQFGAPPPADEWARPLGGRSIGRPARCANNGAPLIRAAETSAGRSLIKERAATRAPLESPQTPFARTQVYPAHGDNDEI